SFRDSKLCDNCGQLFSSDADVCRNCGHKRQSSAEMREEMILNAKEDVRVSVFNKLQDHNEVHRDELPKGLERLSNRTAAGVVELEEFLNFVKGYEARQDNFYKSPLAENAENEVLQWRTFEEADLDNSGTMEAAGLQK
ncbi:unnamed protein product, partial [Cladocopium goreaui]